MKVRKALKYPPFYNLAMINIISDKFELCNVESNKIATYLKNNVSDAIILGPTSSIIPKINNKFYMQITIKYKYSDNLYQALKFINGKYIDKKVRVEIDINPIK